MKSDLEDHYSDPHLMILINKACFLDSRFKSLLFLSDKNRTYVIHSVEEKATCLKSEMISSNKENPADGPKA